MKGRGGEKLREKREEEKEGEEEKEKEEGGKVCGPKITYKGMLKMAFSLQPGQTF
jgi:hypothetical protein